MQFREEENIKSYKLFLNFKKIRLFLLRFSWVLWHIYHYRLFNTKSGLYIYIKYIRFGFVGFYGTSTIVDYLMPNPVYNYILVIYDLWTYVNKTKWLQVLLCITNNSIKHQLFVYTQLND